MKGTIERIEENDDQRKRTSERTSVQTRPLSDKVNRNFDVFFSNYFFYMK